MRAEILAYFVHCYIPEASKNVGPQIISFLNERSSSTHFIHPTEAYQISLFLTKEV